MLRQGTNEDRSFDPAMAEQALALALRLQHEGGQRVSLQELQRTADEAEIQPAYLQSALERLAEPAESGPNPSTAEARFALRVLAGMFSFAAILLDTSVHSSNAPLLPFMITALAVGLIVAVFLTRQKQPR